jgi:RimJ/RimL family protein N-acetyltransferase
MFHFETEWPLFREHRRGDLEDYCPLEADAEVRRYVGGAPRPREVAVRKFRDTLLKNAARKLALRATIFKADDRYIGYSGLYPKFRPGGAVRSGAGVLFGTGVLGQRIERRQLSGG